MKFVLAYVAFASVAGAQNLLCNGGFELPQFTNETTISDVPCWHSSFGQRIEVQRRVGGYAEGTIGSQHVELDVGANSDIYQDMATVVGQRYLIRLWLANRVGSSSSGYRIIWDGTVLGTAVRNAAQTVFSRGLVEVVASRPVSRLVIAADGPSDSMGDLVDEVSVIPIPSPGSRLGYNYYIPHYADGGGWASSLLIANTSTSFPANIEYTVYGDDGAELDPRLNGSITLNAAGSTVIESPRPATLRTGWVRIASSEPLQASVIFRSILEGRFDLEASVIARARTTETMAPFDNANFITGFAVANPNAIPITLSIRFYEASGQLTSITTLPLGPLAHTSFALDEKFAVTRSKRGSMQIRATDGFGYSVDFLPLGLRFAPGGTFTTLPY